MPALFVMKLKSLILHKGIKSRRPDNGLLRYIIMATVIISRAIGIAYFVRLLTADSCLSERCVSRASTSSDMNQRKAVAKEGRKGKLNCPHAHIHQIQDP